MFNPLILIVSHSSIPKASWHPLKHILIFDSIEPALIHTQYLHRYIHSTYTYMYTVRTHIRTQYLHIHVHSTYPYMYTVCTYICTQYLHIHVQSTYAYMYTVCTHIRTQYLHIHVHSTYTYRYIVLPHTCTQYVHIYVHRDGLRLTPLTSCFSRKIYLNYFLLAGSK